MPSRTFTPEEFEKRVAQITQVLEAGGAEVTITWNARVPDPDNPEQARQVDVLVTRGDEMTLIECRHHSRAQDVKWVEELYGRKVSLNATQIIGVSSSGFTVGAIAKAARLGVFLRELIDVSDSEAREWGVRAKVTLEYVALSDIHIYLVTADRIAIPVTQDLLFMATKRSDGSALPIVDALSRVARIMPNTPLKEGPIATCVSDVTDVYVGSVRVLELLLEFNWQLVRREQVLPLLLSYTAVGTPVTNIGNIQASGHSRTAVTYADEFASAIVDVSVNSFSPCSFLSKVQVEFGRPVVARAFGLIGLEDARADGTTCLFHAIARHSRKYRLLKQATRRPGSSIRVPWNYPDPPTS